MNDNEAPYTVSIGEWARQEVIIMFEFVGWVGKQKLIPEEMTVDEWEKLYHEWHDSETGDVPKSLSDPVKT